MTRKTAWAGTKIYTIGHSTHPVDKLIQWLQAFEISILADIRTIPRSRRNPQFNADALPATLRPHGIRYVHLPALGGLRRARKDSPNMAFRNASFRGFADYMLTEDFDAGLEQLNELTWQGKVAVMCAEAVPFRCHRSLVADALTVLGAHVEHIASATRATPHRLRDFAHVEGSRLTYPGEPASDADLGTPLATRAPFHLEATVRVLQRRPSNLVEVWDEDRYLRVLPSGKRQVLVEVANRGTIDAPDLRFSLRSGTAFGAAREKLGQTLRKILGTDVAPEPLQRLAEAEPRLRPTALALRGMRPPRFATLFEAFINVVPFQQLSLEAGISTVNRLVQRFGEPLDVGGRRYHTFPSHTSIAGARLDALRKCGLSLKKAEALRFIAKAIERGDVSETKLSKLETKAALESLIELPGIGPWSAALVLLRGLGRIDVFPPRDTGVTKGLGALLQARSEKSLERVIQRFGDYRGFLYFCSLGANLLSQGLIHEAQRTAPTKPN